MKTCPVYGITEHNHSVLKAVAVWNASEFRGSYPRSARCLCYATQRWTTLTGLCRPFELDLLFACAGCTNFYARRAGFEFLIKCGRGRHHDIPKGLGCRYVRINS